MKKIAPIIFVLVIMLIGMTLAGAIGVINSEKIMNKERLNVLKEKAGTDVIKPVISNIRCDVEYCLAVANQKGLINYPMKVSARYCSLFNESENSEGECLEYTAYSDSEIREVIEKKVENKLTTYADAEIERNTPKQEKDMGGTIKFKEKK